MVFANFKLNNYDESISLLKQIIENKPDLEYVNGLGECMIKAQQYKGFVEYVEKFSKAQKKSIKSMHLDIISKYGECLYKSGEKEQADEYLKLILNFNIINVSDLIRSIGQMYEDNQDYKKALVYYSILVNT